MLPWSIHFVEIGDDRIQIFMDMKHCDYDIETIIAVVPETTQEKGEYSGTVLETAQEKI